MLNPARCSKCGSTECSPLKCRFCDCPSWWNCEVRGCYVQGALNYSDAAIRKDISARHEGRTDHDLDVFGNTLRPGR